MSPVLYLVSVIAEARVIDEARKQACRFIRSECPATKDTPDVMLQTPLSPTGQLPATHYICTRHMRQDEIERQAQAIQTYPAPVAAYVVESEEAFLASQGLRKVN